MSSCWDGLARLLLVLINIVFLLIGLAITVCGFILRYAKALYEPFLETGMNQLQKVLTETNLASFKVTDIDIGEVVMSLAIGLIIGGLVLVGISFLGCCGACCKVRFMLWLYAIVIIVFVVVEAVGIGLLYGKPDMVKGQLKSQMSEYEGLKSEKVFSLGWNIIMIQFQCCGVDSYEDFDMSAQSKWNNPGISGVTTLETPIACCKTLPSSQTATEFNCAMKATLTEDISNYKTGCYQTIWKSSFGNTAIAVPVLVICGIVQVLFIIFAIMVAKSENDRVSPI
ncbi:tetraspanin-18-like [Mercenaria mercenaria]|uniref:tetraspanin-18-like n=1 Tax=Mercenaria mercenaria TaxID=6596 RepID=UPI00234E7B49|nr:tetraspanin-18-like [Mercenaria mercenaria]